ncbi:MAG: DUF370 domain-containing protein [Ardenticatenaceae bacterium]|nr:DUF370 domain-containing protein [Anaerolineales bacterium]MCB9005932.1 DUF370 domain-containing protein [Ardenticatenaceae bacterium]
MKQNNGFLEQTAVPTAPGWLAIGEAGFLQQSRIVSVAPANTAPLRRLLKATPPELVVVLTGGQRRKTAVFLDSGHLILTALSLAEWQALLNR